MLLWSNRCLADAWDYLSRGPHPSSLRMFKTVLSGQGTGAPFFFAWSIVTLSVFLLSTLHHTAWPLSNLRMLLSGFLLLYTCQSILLISDWRRRALWVSVYLVHITPPIGTAKFSESYFLLVHAMHGMLLLGSRRRVWVWLALAAILHPKVSNAWLYFALIHSQAMTASSHSVPMRMLPPYFIWYPFGVQILFGAVTAFLMPPINKPTQEQPAAE